jgi:hypothetical protein
MNQPATRRTFLQSVGAVAAGGLAGAGSPQPRRKRVAALYSLMHHRSHAHVILENFLYPYLFNGRRVDPAVEVVSLYADQRAQRNDLTDQVARQFHLPLYRTIEEALCLGGRQLAVDAVLSIVEQGNYPNSALGQRMYPRKRFFDEIVAVLQRSGRMVPVFNDKHLSYRWDWARSMFDTTLQFEIPFMAGSSVPLAQRIPALEFAQNASVEEAVAIHGGPIESYDFHGLEILQALAECRRGSETGVAAVEVWRGEALWNAARQRRWNLALGEAAMAAELGQRPASLAQIAGTIEPAGIHVEYVDGFRATVLKLGFSATRWNLAWKAAGQAPIQATRFYVGPWNNRNLFRALSHAIQHFFIEQTAPYPVERTLLTTGILEAAMRSRAENRRLRTRHLHIRYAPRDYRAFRETGASWRIITPNTPEPFGLAPAGVG